MFSKFTGNTCAGVSFSKSCWLKICISNKKRLKTKYLAAKAARTCLYRIYSYICWLHLLCAAFCELAFKQSAILSRNFYLVLFVIRCNTKCIFFFILLFYFYFYLLKQKNDFLKSKTSLMRAFSFKI